MNAKCLWPTKPLRPALSVCVLLLPILVLLHQYSSLALDDQDGILVAWCQKRPNYQRDGELIMGDIKKQGLHALLAYVVSDERGTYPLNDQDSATGWWLYATKVGDAPRIRAIISHELKQYPGVNVLKEGAPEPGIHAIPPPPYIPAKSSFWERILHCLGF